MSCNPNSLPEYDSSIVVCEEISQDYTEVNEKDIEEYCQRLGIDLKANPSLATLVREWILQPLPRYWYPCLDTGTGLWFYSNALNGESTWEHPLEEIHRALAREYCDPQHFHERGNPEGESAEPSMELNSKESLSLSPLHLGPTSAAKNPLPRALAPLKRAPKLEPISSTGVKPLLNPIAPNPQSLRTEIVRDVSFSTFKPSEPPISSLLPSDQLFEKPIRPVSASLSTRPILPITKLIPSSNNALNEEKRPLVLDPPTPDPISNSPLQSSTPESVESLKPLTTLSFTDRLAAKKASRSKGNITEPLSPLPNDPVVPPNIPNDNKKHVQFDLESAEIRQYTPEYSEEASKMVDKSESSSSEEFLDFRDPGLLKPIGELANYPIDDEKRWDISFSSFGVTSTAKESPIKKASGVSKLQVQEIDGDEMVTRFNSEYCPSPLPIEIPESNQTNNQKNLQTDSKLIPDEEQNNPVIDRSSIQKLSMDSLRVTPIQRTQSLGEEQKRESFDAVLVKPPPFAIPLQRSQSMGEEKGGLTIHVPSSVSKDQYDSKLVSKKETVTSSNITPLVLEVNANIEPNNGKLSGPTRKDRPVMLARSITRNDSLEGTLFPVNATVNKELPSHSVDSKPHRNIELSTIKSASQVSSPIHVQDKVIIQVPPVNEAPSVNQSQSESVARATNVNTTQEDWLRMKLQMERTLEEEKSKLERWFNQEIAQIKSRFESELVNERRRTEDLCKLVESAKEEKDKVALNEINRLEETLSRFIDEKSRMHIEAPVARCQDAIIQTEPAVSSIIVTPPKRGLFSEEPQNNIRVQSPSNSESQVSSTQLRPTKEKSKHIECQCDKLQKQVARVEKEMQLLKQKNLSFQKSPASTRTKKKSTPVKAQRESWWIDSDIDDDSGESSSSYSDWRASSRGRSRSLTNLHSSRENISGKRSVTPVQRARGLLFKNQVHRRAWMDDSPTDRSTDTVTSGVSSAVSTGDWDTVLSSIQKISGDLQEVWSHIGPRPHSAYLPSKNAPWMLSTASPFHYASCNYTNTTRVPSHWSLSGSTVERTQALRLWLQRNNPQISQPML